MKNNILYLILSFIGLSFVISCSKEDKTDIYVDKYQNGKIEFTYPVLKANGVIDTTLVFTSSGLNISELDHYGYFEPAIGWSQLLRLNPNNFENHVGIFFLGTDLNKLSYPYTFNRNEFNRNAQINYVVGYKKTTNNSGEHISLPNTYAATTNSDNFELTIISKDSNRVKGFFRGKIQNQDGDVINIKNGVFDIKIVEK
jgi:hypothetical protein